MPVFEYGDKEIDYLKRKDKKLAVVIDKIGKIEREINPDTFAALVSSIVSQQISNKAAETVWGRLYKLLGGITPERIAGVKLEAIQSCGMSLRKAGYIKGIADAALTGEADFDALHTMPDEAIIKQLTKLNGVGVWTVEMLLIFSLGRMDILSYKDLAICRGMMRLYNLKELPKQKFDVYRKRYSPYGSVASLYLWALSAQ